MGCQYCDGSGFIPAIRVNDLTKQKRIVHRECYCLRSSKIFFNPSYPLLTFLGEDLYLLPEAYDKQLKFTKETKLKDIPNYLIEDTDNYSFNLHLKSVIMDHDFVSEYPLNFYYNTSIKVVHDFYVRPSEEASISDLREKFDIVILSFGTEERNDAMPTSLLAVLENRLNASKPTWIYLKKPLPLCTEVIDREKRSYLDSFNEYFHGFKRISLTPLIENKSSVVEMVPRQQKADHSNFRA